MLCICGIFLIIDIVIMLYEAIYLRGRRKFTRINFHLSLSLFLPLSLKISCQYGGEEDTFSRFFGTLLLHLIACVRKGENFSIQLGTSIGKKRKEICCPVKWQGKLFNFLYTLDSTGFSHSHF